jgi:hypothetical protein
MVGTLLNIGDLLRQTLHQSFGYLTQEYTSLAHWVKETSIGIAPQLRW